MSGPRLRVAVTGAGGRLGTAVIERLRDASAVEETIGWDLPEHDLDDPASAERLVARDLPDLVVHCAAWTDVDGCARDPELAKRRNGAATGDLAHACVAHGAGLLVVSTNEVFDGSREDGCGYVPTDLPHPINPYGSSKLAGERAAAEVFASAPDGLTIVRTAWLFGPGAPDFPRKIIAAALRAVAAGEPLSIVSDEWGSPTYTNDLAAAIVELATSGQSGGLYHVVNSGEASRAEWAREVLRLAAIDVPTLEVAASTWQRPSKPPRWGVLEPTPLPSGRTLRAWQEAMAEYADVLKETSS